MKSFRSYKGFIPTTVATYLLESGSNFRNRFSSISIEAPKHAEVPRNLQKQGRKPFVTDINELKRRARLGKRFRQEACEIALKAPENGLLVNNLIPVAHEVYAARIDLISCVSSIIKGIPVYLCSTCGEVHVGPSPHKIRTCNIAGSLPNKEHKWVHGGIENVLPVIESFHLYDRLGRAVSHEERLEVDRIPAVVELCVQAGVNLLEYPTRRRTFPIYNISGKIIDFEKRFPRDVNFGNDFEACGFWQKREKVKNTFSEVSLVPIDVQGLAIQGMKAWEKMRAGALKLMKKYPVQTCGYCSEVQVGTKGHRARICQAYKHQMRDGQHSWQEATIDDLIPPIYVWHLHGRGPQLLTDRLKRYYGKLPAVVELFSQAGAPVSEEYAGLMREDVVVPDLDEEKWVV